MKIKNLLLVLSACISLTATHIYAADYTFRVPVELRNVQESARSFSVICGVYSSNSNFGSPNRIAFDEGGTSFNVDGTGNYVGVVTVTANIEAGKNVADARYYRCQLHINSTPVENRRDGFGSTAAFESKAGTPRVVTILEPLPR